MSSIPRLPDGYNAGELTDSDVPRLAAQLAPLYGAGSVVRWVLERVAAPAPAARAEEIGVLLFDYRNVAYLLGLACGESEDCPSCGEAIPQAYTNEDREELHAKESAARAAVDAAVAELGRERDEARRASEALLARVVAAGVFKNVESVPEVIAVRATLTGGPPHAP